MPGLGCKAIHSGNQGEILKGDTFCDDLNNNVGCDWDGGDCCGPNVKTDYCTECECLDPNFQGGISYIRT